MKKNVILLSAIVLTFLFTSCQQEVIEPVVEPDIRFSNVDPQLRPYYSAFEAEANRRGFDYDLTELNILGKIEEIHQENVAGSCMFGRFIDNEVTIDQTFWNRSSPIFKEFVVFHELGHCVLLRGHDESADAQGRCLSIMRSGTLDCRDAYSLQNRDFYLDELFFDD
ncbi:MAG: hypothetical protein AAGA77_14805 [Bacteroidota bacterium]